MTENPYAPPSAELDSHDTIAGSGDFEIGVCVSDAWAATWANFPLWLGFGLVFTVLAGLSMVTVVGFLLALPHLAFGATFFVLRMHDREAEFGDMFAGFTDYGRVLVNIVVIGLITFVLGMLAQSVQLAGTLMENTLVYGIGTLVYLAFSLLVSPRLSLAYFYLVDQDATGVDALRMSWEHTDRSKWKFIGLILVSVGIFIAGVLALVVGIFPAMVMTYLMWASAYRQIEGRPTSA